MLKLAQGVAVGQAIDAGHFVNDQHAIKVVVLVLPDASGQTGAFEGEGFAGQVLGRDGDSDGAADLTVDVGEAKAALLAVFGLAAGVGKGGIDENQVVFWLTSGVGNEKAPGKANLGGGQTHPGGLVHELEHAKGDVPNILVNGGDGRGFTAEGRVGVKEDA